MCMMRERREEGARILDVSWRMAVTSVVSGSEGSWIVMYLLQPVGVTPWEEVCICLILGLEYSLRLAPLYYDSSILTY